MGQPQALPVEVPPEPAALPLIFSDVFIPNAAWPGTGHHSDSFPPVTFTVTVRVAPGAMEAEPACEGRGREADGGVDAEADLADGGESGRAARDREHLRRLAHPAARSENLA